MHTFVKMTLGFLASAWMLQASAATSPTINNNVFTEDKPSITISEKQPEFTLKLKSNPTTGYSWFLREYDAALITPLKHSYQAGNKNLVGASGFEIWKFRANPAAFAVPHQTVLRMVYARPWQASDNTSQVVFGITTVPNN